MFFGDLKDHLDPGTVVGGKNGGAESGQFAGQRLIAAVIDFDFQMAIGYMGNDSGFFQYPLGGMTVGSGQTAGTEFDPAEIADDRQAEIDQMFTLKMIQYGTPGGAGRFPVVEGAFPQALGSLDAPGVHDMGGLGMMGGQIGQESVQVAEIRGRGDDRDETRAFDFVFAAVASSYRESITAQWSPSR